MRTRILLVATLVALASIAGAQSQDTPNHTTPRTIKWDWNKYSWTMNPGSKATIDFSGVAAFTFLADSIDFEDIVDAASLDAAFSITGTAGETFSLVRTLTDMTAENGMRLAVTAQDTTPTTTAQYGFYLDNLASTEGLDAFLVLDNSDADDAVAAGIHFIDAGGGITSTFSGLTSYVFHRTTTGTVTITATDDDANAALTVSAGGTGNLNLGSATNNLIDMASATGYRFLDAGADHSLTISVADLAAASAYSIEDVGTTGQFAITDDATPAAGALMVGNAGGTSFGTVTMSGDATLASTGALTIAAGAVEASMIAADAVDGTELADTITLDAAFTLGANGQTIAIDSSDWDISATGVMTGIGNITSDGTVDANVYTANSGAGGGLDTQDAGILEVGAATATGVQIGDSGVTTDIEGDLEVLGDIDTTGAAALLLGADAATSVEIADSAVLTDIQGTLSVDEVATFDATVVFSGGQTRQHWMPALGYDGTNFSLSSGWNIDATNPPAQTAVATPPNWGLGVLRFDADGGSTGDDVAYITWMVPPGYVVDSLRMLVVWRAPGTEVAGDDVVFAGTTQAAGLGENVAATGTAWGPFTDEQITGTEGETITTSCNIEVEDIAVADIVHVKLTVDETASEIGTGGCDVIGVIFQWESTE